MKDKATLVIALVLAAAIGALTTMLFRAESAAAQQGRRWTRCFVADFGDRADGDNPQHMREARGGIAIPEGWTPVGGGSMAASGVVVLCR